MEQNKSVFNSVKKAWKNGVNKMKKFFRTGKEKKSSSLQPSSNANQPIPDESDNSIKIPNPSSPLEASFSPILPVKLDSSKENLSTSNLPPPPPPLPPSPPSTSFRGTGREMPEDRRRVEICASDLVEARARLRPVGERKTVGRNEVNTMESPSTSVDSHTTNMSPSPTPPPPPPPSPTLQPSSPLPPTAENRSDVPRRVEICASDLLEARAKLKPVGERRKIGTNEVGAENLSTSFSSRKDSEKKIERPPVKSDNHEELPQLPPTSPVDPDVELQLRLIDKQLKRIKSLLSILEGEGTASAEQPFEPRTSPSFSDSTSQNKQLHLMDLIHLIQEQVRKIEFLVSVLESQGNISAEPSPSPDSTTPSDQLRLIEEHVRRIEFLVSLLDSTETISLEQPHEEPQVSPSSPDSTNRVEIINETQSNFNFGLDLFHRVNGGKLAEKDKFECCAKLDGKYKDMFLIFTNNRILVASAKGKIKWQTKWNKIKGSSPIVHDEDENVDMLTFEYKSPKYVFRRSTFCEFYVVKTEKTFLLEPGQQHFLNYYSTN